MYQQTEKAPRHGGYGLLEVGNRKGRATYVAGQLGVTRLQELNKGKNGNTSKPVLGWSRISVRVFHTQPFPDLVECKVTIRV